MGASDFVLRVLPLLFKSPVIDLSLIPDPNLVVLPRCLCLSNEVTDTEMALLFSICNVGVAGAGGLLLLVRRGPLTGFWLLLI